MAAGVKPGVEVARQLYLYGKGDGRPVVNTERLAELAGLSVGTIRRHLPAWAKEREEIVSNSEGSALGLSLSPKILSQHKEDVEFLRNLVSAKKWEIDRLEEITIKLEGWMDKFEDEDKDYALRILEAWQRNCGHKAQLETQFIALQKQWTSLSGVLGMMDVSLTAAKEISKGKAKLDLKKLESEGQPKQVGGLSSGVFARPSISPVVSEGQ